MKKYSWYTNPVKVTDYLTVYQYAVDREIFLEKRKDGSTSFILIKKGTYVTRHDGGWQRYKPNLKGGHTHNHIYNKCHKHIFRSKQARKNVDRKDKPEFVRIFYMNLKLGNYSFDKLLHTIFHHNKCARTAKKDLRKR